MKKIIFNISLERVKIQCQQWANLLSAPRVAHEVLPTWSAGLQPKTRLQAERHGPRLECLCVGPVPKVSPSSVVPTPPSVNCPGSVPLACGGTHCTYRVVTRLTSGALLLS